MIGRLLDQLRREEGSVLLFVAIATPVLVAAFAIAVDIGDWFVRGRALQNQVDAAAFAGADKWQACFNSSGTGFTLMKDEANKYSGTGVLNAQIGGTIKGQLQPLAFNSTTFPPTGPTNFSSDTGLPLDGSSCTQTPDNKYVFDVKATENNEPLILGSLFPSLVGPDLHAAARLELRLVQSLNPSMPLAVPDVNPASMSITIIDQTSKTTGTTLAACSTSQVTYGVVTPCSFTRTTSSFPPVTTTTGGGSKTWNFNNITFKVPTGEKNNIIVRVGLGATAGACDFGTSGGTGYVCLEGFSSDPNFAPDPPILSVVPSQAIANNVNSDTQFTVKLEGNFGINTPCTGTAGASYTCATDPTVKLRFASQAGSHTYAIDCGTLPGGSGGDFYQQIRYGCANPFQVNDPPAICPDTVTNPPDCAPVNNAVGDKIGQLRQAMDDRFAANGCPANNYPNTAVDGDPRIVILIVTDFSAFYGSGGGTSVPVVTYAAFYVTGWDSQGSTCSTVNSPYPVDPTVKNDKPHGDIWGHFITYVTSATASTQPCAVGSLTPCTPSLVR